MSQWIETRTKTFIAGGALAQHRRVRLSNGKLAYADAADDDGLGTLTRDTFADGDLVAVDFGIPGTQIMGAHDVIAVGAGVYAAANGRVADAGTVKLGIALTAAGAQDDLIEVKLANTTSATIVHEHTGNDDGGKLTSPRIVTGLNDTNGLPLVKVTATGSAVNEVTLANAATGSGPTLTASGSDTNIPVTLAAKGNGKLVLGQATSGGIKLAGDQPILDSSDNELLIFSKTDSAVNEVTLANAATGQNATLTASGETDAGISLVSKGTGSLKLVAVDGDAVEVKKDSVTKIGFFAATPARWSSRWP
jgi:hypothetical protein